MKQKTKKVIIDHLFVFYEMLFDKNLFCLTAMDIFNMDYNMVLCLTASLISISVLFCQLSPDTNPSPNIEQLVENFTQIVIKHRTCCEN